MSERQRGDDRGKKRKWANAKQQFGSRNKKKDLGRGAWSRQRADKRTQNEEANAKRQKLDDEGEERPSVLPKPFSQEEIDAEERKPKHKVAVLIGYSGSGYRGMQINTTERTIEGDLFTAFVGAGAISKANANDPKKSGLVRCARTDKGVHAAGNVVSLKLILEDSDIVKKINDLLSPQIRVWGIQRTVGSFSCYQACDSRWYEYLIPSHAFLPPHPNSFLGKALVELAEDAGDIEGYRERQDEVKDFWAETEEKCIKPILDDLDESTREIVLKALYDPDDDAEGPGAASNSEDAELAEKDLQDEKDDTQETQTSSINGHQLDSNQKFQTDAADGENAKAIPTANGTDPDSKTDTQPPTDEATDASSKPDKRTLDAIIKRLRAAYLAAKRSYRISPARLARIQPTLDAFIGTHSFHNYTIQKAPTDPSAKRLIKSFTLDPTPKLIGGTEWLSIKIHGQSFMMHQIRKMVSAVALLVRGGADAAPRVADTFADAPLSIPKVPGLGLLLERPVFDSYNANTAARFQRDEIDFARFSDPMLEFKQREIYARIFREEDEGSAFHTFFGHIDGFRTAAFLWVSSKGLEATKITDGSLGGVAAAGSRKEQSGAARRKGQAETAVDSEDESDAEEGRRRPDTDG